MRQQKTKSQNHLWRGSTGMRTRERRDRWLQVQWQLVLRQEQQQPEFQCHKRHLDETKGRNTWNPAGFVPPVLVEKSITNVRKGFQVYEVFSLQKQTHSKDTPRVFKRPAHLVWTKLLKPLRI